MTEQTSRPSRPLILAVSLFAALAAAAGLVVAGVAMWSLPLALIVAGVLLAALAVLALAGSSS